MKRQQNHKMRIVWLGTIAGIFLSMASVSPAVEYAWTLKADMPTPRWGHTSAVVDGKIYVIGGGTSEGGPDEKLLATVEEYDPASDTWTRKTDMPTPRGWNSPSSAVVDGRIYVISGSADVDWSIPTVEQYDPTTDTWTRKADIPTGRDCLATVAVDGKIYAIGGCPHDEIVGLKTVEMYDPTTDTWAGKADMPHGVWYVNANVVNGKIYVLGGRPNLQARPWVQEYDPATDTWTLRADMPVPTSNMASVVLGKRIIVIGGWLWSMNDPYTTVQMYDPQADTWTIEADAPFQRAVFSADVVDNRIYAIGGTYKRHPCPATSTVYELTIRVAPPDFSADGSVDIKDLLILIESWGQSDPVADIAPPLGDGVVDVHDLEFLMGFWGQELDDPTLVAHWALNETEGIVAKDGAGNHDGVVTGIPAWQPAGGKKGGCLQCDGTTFVVATHVLNPSGGPFSILAWVQGGAPGQVIVSQEGRVNWLLLDPLTGLLMTELKSSGRSARVLYSDAAIADGAWHRVGFVWDGTNRRLYVDDVLVAEDIQKSLAASSGNLIIGAGKGLAPGTFWSGLIDDVRVYNRAVRPQ